MNSRLLFSKTTRPSSRRKASNLEFVYLFIFVATLTMYLLDRKGWHATAKRVTTIVRSNIEAKVPVPQLEPVKAADDWEQQFKEIENPQPLVPIEQPKKHAIIRHGYKEAYNGLWPQWTCKCGRSDVVPIGIYSDEKTHAQARDEGAEHVRTANLAEERLEKAKGTDFAW